MYTPQFEKRDISESMAKHKNLRQWQIGVCERGDDVGYQNGSTNLTGKSQFLNKEESKEDVKDKFKYVVVKNLKDSSNYFRFINNWPQYMAKLQKDKHWLEQAKNKRSLELVQNKIDKRIHIDFSDALQEMENGKRFVFLEIDNTIWKITEEPVEGCEDPIVITHSKSNRNHPRDKSQRKLYVYLRRFGLEFLEFLCVNHEVILYTHLDKEITEFIISTFHDMKEGIDFAFVIWGKPFNKSINNNVGPIKSLNKIIPTMESLSQDEDSYREFIKQKFLILDWDILSYYENFEDIHVPILPIVVQDEVWMSTLNMPQLAPTWSYEKIKRNNLHRRQSSLKDLRDAYQNLTFEESLKNHCLFYLKQLLSQSLGMEQDNSELLKSVSISWLVNHW